MTAATYTNLRWGPNLSDLFDVALHPVRDGGAGNPLLIYRHPGGGTSGDKGDVWRGAHTEMTALFDYLLSSSRAVHFDIASMESDQQSFDPAYIPRGRRVHFPGIVQSYQRGIRNTRMVLKDYGSDPDRVCLIGGSHGSWLAVMSMLMQPEMGGSGVRYERRRRFDTRGYNSRVKAIIPWQMAYPDWRKVASATGRTFTNVTASSSPHRLTLAGAFTRYRFTAGDVAVITSGATPGTYTIASKDAGNGFITLASAPGTGACSGYLSTDQVDLSFSTMLFGTRSPGNGADGMPIHAEWDSLPASLRTAVSPLAWAQGNQLAYAVPTYFVSMTGGNGQHPYGNSYDAGSDIHDYHGAQDLSAALAAKGKSSVFESYTGTTDWTNNAIPARLYNWLVARLAE